MADTVVRTARSLDQARAGYAWACAEQAKSKLNAKFGEYAVLAKKAPAMVTTNGLGQTLAFLAAKGSDGGRINAVTPHGRLYRDIEQWLTRTQWPVGVYAAPTENESGPTKLILRVAGNDSVLYRQATAEVLDLLVWLKSLAAALDEDDSDAEAEEGGDE